MVAIRLESKGGVIYRQRRVGRNGAEFDVLKLRTMVHGAERIGGGLRIDAGDERITRVGALLRRTSFDEVPNLVNVLRGEMSLIGPRPHALAHDNYFERVLEDYAFRHHVKPGMTGWAQAHGLRGATPTVEMISERVKMDLWYINNWTLWLDLQILIKTSVEVLRKRNAY